MQTKDVQARTWYGTKEKYGHPQPVLVHSTSRYSTQGWNFESTEVFANPDGNMAQGRRYRHGGTTGLLAVRLQKDAWETVRNWVLHGENEQAAQDVMREAALLLDKVVAEIATRNRVPLKELRQEENDRRGFILTVIHPRDLDGAYETAAREKHEREEAAKQARENQEQAKRVRAERMAATLARADSFGINTDRFKGGAHDSPRSYADHTVVEMSVDTFEAVLDEIERLRVLVRQTLRADETGEDGTSAGA